VELLVVIAVIALLIGLLLPAVQSIRESARRNQCKANVRQLATGCRQYESVYSVLPAPGRHEFVGDPDLGAEHLQLGGWLYNILPYVEQSHVHAMGAGLPLTAAVGQPTKPGEIAKRIAVSVPIYVCPSRGSAVFAGIATTASIDPRVPFKAGRSGASSNIIRVFPSEAARSDYAGAWGEPNGNLGGGGALEGRITGNSDWAYGREMSSLRDGYSNIFLCGERYLAPEQYRPVPGGVVSCNDRGWSIGREADVYSTVALNATTPVPPMRDTAGLDRCASVGQNQGGSFGGPHDGVVMAMCDGAVRVVDFGVDPAVFMQLGRGHDGGGVDLLD
jgi:type II secretory pathway pseudopilin PulG